MCQPPAGGLDPGHDPAHRSRPWPSRAAAAPTSPGARSSPWARRRPRQTRRRRRRRSPIHGPTHSSIAIGAHRQQPSTPSGSAANDEDVARKRRGSGSLRSGDPARRSPSTSAHREFQSTPRSDPTARRCRGRRRDVRNARHEDRSPFLRAAHARDHSISGSFPAARTATTSPGATAASSSIP